MMVSDDDDSDSDTLVLDERINNDDDENNVDEHQQQQQLPTITFNIDIRPQARQLTITPPQSPPQSPPPPPPQPQEQPQPRPQWINTARRPESQSPQPQQQPQPQQPPQPQPQPQQQHMRHDPRLQSPPEDAPCVFYDIIDTVEPPRMHSEVATMRLLLRSRFPTWRWSRGDLCPIQGMLGHTSCSVCQENYTEGQRLLGLMCGHTYHYLCIINWFQTVALEGSPPGCPQCRVYAFSRPIHPFYARMHF